ncbi:hypothetical protein MKX01_016787 [Papaver californicum]|nr:hypothetical protein MKX01_016787 [Papaver californicum]
MESENRSTSYRRSGSELFICFTSRNSSSVKVCSKSAQSPGRNSGKFSNSSSSSLSCSLSRRLRSNGSIKGSPMFPTGSQKKKGSSSETTAEPSSPKVTCIGQVRVKTKKQGQKFRKKKSKRRDASFRKTDDGSFHSQPLQQQQQQQQQECLPHRSQRWVHLPLSICDALRAFGAEFSCLLPCKPSCLTRGIKKRRQPRSTERNTSSCRQIFEKWVMTSLHESEHQNRDNHNNETELVVSRREDGMRRGRREEEVVGEIEIHISEEKRVSICNEEEEAVEVEEEEEEEEDGRVSICIPPRNALLLMRCRSEPLRMSALANHFWESPVKDKIEEDDLQHKKQVLVAEEEDDTDSDSDSDEEEVEDGEEEKDSDDDEVEDETEVKLQLKNPPIEHKFWKKEENTDISLEEHQEEEENGDNAKEIVVKKIEEDVNESGYSVQPVKEEEEEKEEDEILEIEDNEEEPRLQRPEEEKELIVELKEERIDSKRPSTSSRRASFSSCTRSIHEGEEAEAEEKEQIPEAEPFKVVVFEEKVNIATEEKATKPRTSVEKRGTMKINNRNNNEEEELPDCLLLMMCEPKLSMEVSKETWVCSTDFIRYRPERRVVQNNGGGDHDHSKKRNSTDSKGRHSLDSKNRLSTDSKSRLSTDSNPGDGRPPLRSKHQKPPTPPRRSISKPTPPSIAKSTMPAPPPPPAKLVPPVEVATSSSAMATMIEKKLVNAVAYEPLVLTRCNSEPMRSSAKLAPEACFWKNMKLEPHTQGPPNLGVGAATGIGF